MDSTKSDVVEDHADDLEPGDAELVSPQGLQLVGPLTTIGGLSAPDAATEIILRKRKIVAEMLRTFSLQMLSPADVVLFKARDEDGGLVVAYIQECGCQRYAPLWGVRSYNISRPEKIAGDEPGEFYYVITGDGECSITGQRVEGIEGGRSSLDDFCRGKRGAELEMLVRKAARANFESNLTRRLTGTQSVPVEELERAWKGTHKKISDCRLGRGFGTRAERVGAPAPAPDVPAPSCGVCGKPGRYYPATRTRGAFYGCPDYAKHPSQKWSQDAEKWIAAHPPAPREVGQEG